MGKSSSWAASRAGRAFIASAKARDTSPEIMAAIAGMATSEQEAIAIHEGDAWTWPIVGPRLFDLWREVTLNGRWSATSLRWGKAGTTWWYKLRRVSAEKMRELAELHPRPPRRQARGTARKEGDPPASGALDLPG